MLQRILNNRSQPVELHLTSGVVVIPALGEVEVDTGAGEPQLEQLATELRIAILPTAAGSTASEGDEAADEEAAAEGSEQKAAKKSAAKRPR